MKPLRLEIQGLYSYREKTAIDFETLGRGGLFGIFGSVGSGKSAILEAITFVLYGQTERMNQADARPYNMMNLRSDKFFIEFEFQVRGERYLFTASARRNKKNFQKIEDSKRSAYRWTADQWLPLDETGEGAAESVLGLSYENFRRTIIIPQGKFQEFLQLGKADRTKMMGQLFGLERFNLYEACSRLQGENDREFIRLQTRLEAFAGLSEEDLAGREEKRRELESQKSSGRQRLRELRTAETLWKEKLSLAREEESVREELAEISGHLAGTEGREEFFLKIEAARRDFAPLFDRLEEKEKEKIHRQSELAAVEEEVKSLAGEIGGLESGLRELDEKWNRRDLLEGEILRLRKLASWKEQSLLGKAGQEASQKAAGDLEAAGGREALFLKELRERQEALEALKGRQISTEERLAIQDWLTREGNLRASFKEAEADHLDAGGRLEELRLFKKRLTEKADLFQGRLRELFPEYPETSESLDVGPEDLDRLGLLFKEEENAWKLGREAGVLAAGLKPGQACPVCGSLDHPAPAALPAAEPEGGAVSGDERGGERFREFEKWEAELRRLLMREEVLQENLDKAGADRERRHELLKSHYQELPPAALSFLPEEIPLRPEELTLRQELLRILDEQRQLEAERLRRENEREKAEPELETFRREKALLVEEAKEAELRWREIQGGIAALFREIPGGGEGLPEDAALENFADDRLQADKLEADQAALERRRQDLLESLGAKKNELAKAENSRDYLKKWLAELDGQNEDAEKEIRARLESSVFNRKEDVLFFLNQDLSIEEERARIRRWESARESAQKRLDSIKEKIGEKAYNPEEHEAALMELDRAEREQENLQNQAALLGAEIEKQKAGLAEKADLEKQLKSCLARRENLATLAKLFKGQGFVNYVSTLYLRDLAARANLRFERLCNKSLRLELDEDNSFVIRDFLNGGKLRSVKTLSGGQTFQAAFSLALALADSVNLQSAKGSSGAVRESFFFLDEGFGSLDRESLGIVMETLRSLGSENRTLGLISHVEELKQEIPSCLNVIRDEERGSFVKTSW